MEGYKKTAITGKTGTVKAQQEKSPPLSNSRQTVNKGKEKKKGEGSKDSEEKQRATVKSRE